MRCTVTRLPGAPPRRAGMAWAIGTVEADLTHAQIASLRSDPGYRCEPVAAREPVPPADMPPADMPRPRAARTKTKG